MEKLVTTLMRGGVTPDQIGVITPYEGQRAHTVTTMLRVRALCTSTFRCCDCRSTASFAENVTIMLRVGHRHSS